MFLIFVFAIYSLVLIPLTLYKLCGGADGEEGVVKTWADKKKKKQFGDRLRGLLDRVGWKLVVAWLAYLVLFWWVQATVTLWSWLWLRSLPGVRAAAGACAQAGAAAGAAARCVTPRAPARSAGSSRAHPRRCSPSTHSRSCKCRQTRRTRRSRKRIERCRCRCGQHTPARLGNSPSCRAAMLARLGHSSRAGWARGGGGVSGSSGSREQQGQACTCMRAAWCGRRQS